MDFQILPTFPFFSLKKPLGQKWNIIYLYTIKLGRRISFPVQKLHNEWRVGAFPIYNQ